MINIHSNGVNDIYIGDNINSKMNIVKPIAQHPQKNHILISPRSKIDFYYLDSAWQNSGSNSYQVLNIFFGVDSQKIILSITIYLIDSSGKFEAQVASCCEKKTIVAQSSIGNIDSGTKDLWEVNSNIKAYMSKISIGLNNYFIEFQIYNSTLRLSGADMSIHYSLRNFR